MGKDRRYQHRQIRTAGGLIEAGATYQLQWGALRAPVRLLRDRSTDDELKFRLEVLAAAGDWQPGDRITLVAGWDGHGEWVLGELPPEP